MSEEKKTEIASETVKTQLASLTIANAQKDKLITELTAERDNLKLQLGEATAVIENDLKADITVRIMAASDYQTKDLETLSVQQLQAIEETLSKSKGFDVAGTYKSIRAGSASADVSRLTVGGSYGMTQEERAKWLRGEI